jgi:anti-sigma factor RsiW
MDPHLNVPDTASPHELPCQQLVELVTEYFESTLTPPERLRFEEHISVCPPCRRHLKQMRETIRLLGNLNEETISPQARADLMHAFHNWRTADRP